MSKIATYSLADSPLQLSDRLIGTEAPRPIPSSTPLATKNFSLQELLQLFSSNFPAATLQAVLDAGNIATQNIELTGTIEATVIKPVNIEDISGSQGRVFQVLSKAVSGINWVDLPSASWGSITGTITLQTDLINYLSTNYFAKPTGTISQYVRGNGSLATFPTVPVVVPSALTKTDDTNVTLTLGGFPSISLLEPVSLTLGWTGTLADSRIASASVWNAKQSALSGTGIVKSTGGTITYINGTTAQYVRGDGSLATFPNSLTPTLDQVLTQGNTSLNEILLGSEAINGLVLNPLYVNIQFQDSAYIRQAGVVPGNFYTGYFNLSTGNETFANLDGEEGLYLKTFEGVASGYVHLKSDLATTVPRTIQFPDASGTLALTSNITTPTLQQVLDNNHDLVDNNFFAGTDAGNDNSGGSINAFGSNAALRNSGNGVNAIGGNSAIDNTGDNVNAFGYQSGYDQFTDSNNVFNNVNLFGAFANADEDGQTVLSKDGTIMARISTTELTDSRKYTLQDASGTIALTSDIPTAGVTSVGLTMPSAFTVTNSPITSSGDIAVTGAGLVSQYVRGDGTLANFPNSTGGGSSINYYLNGSVSQGTFGGTTYYQLSKTPILGAGTNFTRTNGAGNGYIASFITDAGDPSQLNIPGGNWNVEFYFNASSGGGSPSFYAELYKVSATNVFTLIASDSLNPEGITNGTTVDQYFSSIPVPQTTLLATDRLAVRIFVNTGGKTITLHTENGNLSEVLTTFTTGLTALNGLTQQVQYFNVGTGATNFNISSSGDTHTFNLLFNIRRNANNSSNNNINYNGYAVTGSAESSAVWTITRLTIAASGSVTTATATNVAWTNRESVIYT